MTVPPELFKVKEAIASVTLDKGKDRTWTLCANEGCNRASTEDSEFCPIHKVKPMEKAKKSVELRHLENLMKGVKGAKYSLEAVEADSQTLTIEHYKETRVAFIEARGRVAYLEGVVREEIRKEEAKI